MKRVTILGNNSGRNAGDMAILGNMLRDITEIFTDIEFYVPTTNPKFIRKHFAKYNAKPVGMLPWNGCIKNFGWPMYRAMTNTDLVLICDNILYDRQFYNPLFNNLSSIALFAPACKKRGIPIMFYNASVGPMDYAVGTKALQKVLDATELVTLRDMATWEIFDKIGVSYPEIHVHADCALNTEPAGQARLDEIIEKECLFTNPNGTVGFNVNVYIDHWSKGGSYSRKDFCQDIAGAADRVIEKLDVDIIFFVTQIVDIPVSRQCVDLIKHKDRVKTISNADYTYEEIAPLIGKVEVHNGLRTHTLIFAAAMATPMICITSYPKSAGFLRTFEQEHWQVPMEELSSERLCDIIVKAWDVKDKTSKQLKAIGKKEKEKAKSTAHYLKRFLGD